MKIAIITSSYPRYSSDGIAHSIKAICENIARLGHEVEVLAPYDPEVRPADDQEIPVHRFRYVWPDRLHIMGHSRSLKNDTQLRPLTFLLLPLFLISAFISLWRLTGRQKSDLIYAHWVIPNALVAAWVAGLRKIPFFISLHGSDVFLSKRNRAIGAVAGWVFRRAAGVTACSAEMKQSAIQLGAPKDTLLIAWGADPNDCRPDLRRSEYRREHYGGDNQLIIGVLGRLVAKKGYDNLIAAMPAVLQAFPRTLLVIGGDGDFKPYLVELAEKLGVSDHVLFLGALSRNQVPEFMANNDIFVMPSKRDEYGNVDGLPAVVLEAMSSANAVIASEIAGISLVVEHGKNGLLVPPDNTDELAEAVISLASDPVLLSRLRNTARQDILERFNWQNVACQLTSLFEKGLS